MAIKLRAGDVVHVRATVYQDAESEGNLIAVAFKGGGTLWIRRDNIVHVEPPPLKVGDTVTYRDGPKDMATVLAIAGNMAWVRFQGYEKRGVIVEIDELERA